MRSATGPGAAPRGEAPSARASAGSTHCAPYSGTPSAGAYRTGTPSKEPGVPKYAEWWFCKADYHEHFSRRCAPAGDFVLFSHNSDRAIDRRFERQLRRRELVAWFAANV